jgi:hypothetical protein
VPSIDYSLIEDLLSVAVQIMGGLRAADVVVRSPEGAANAGAGSTRQFFRRLSDHDRRLC